MPDLFLIEFKGNRRGYYNNAFYHSLEKGEKVIVEAERGEDMGLISQQIPEGTEIELEDKPPAILRPATPEDISYADSNTDAEKAALTRCETLIGKHGLPMKLIDSE